MSKFLVTGGAGFIGSHLVDLLVKNNHKLIIVDNLSTGHIKNLEHLKGYDNVLFVERDCLNLNLNDEVFENVEYIIHFAGIGDIVPSIENPSKYMTNNVNGTINMLEIARKIKVKKFVYAASSSCYGLATVPTKEEHKIAPMYPYALSKYLGEMSCFHWNKVYGVPVNSIRIFNAYGTRVRTTGAYGAVFGVFLKQKLSNKPFTVVGDGSQKRDFLFVEDVVDAFYKAATTKIVGEIWNLGAGDPKSINHLTDLLGGEKEYIPKRPGEPDCTWADNSKIKKDLGWEPKISFEEGVKRMVKDINNWKDAPLWDRNSIKKETELWFKYLG